MQNYTKLATKGIKVYKELASKLAALMKMKHAPKLAAFFKKKKKKIKNSIFFVFQLLAHSTKNELIFPSASSQYFSTV